MAVSAKERVIPERLMRNVGKVISRARLESALYGWGDVATMRRTKLAFNLR